MVNFLISFEGVGSYLIPLTPLTGVTSGAPKYKWPKIFFYPQEQNEPIESKEGLKWPGVNSTQNSAYL